MDQPDTAGDAAPPALPLHIPAELTDEQVLPIFDGLVLLLDRDDDPDPHVRPERRPSMDVMRRAITLFRERRNGPFHYHNGSWAHDIKHAAGFTHKR